MASTKPSDEGTCLTRPRGSRGTEGQEPGPEEGEAGHGMMRLVRSHMRTDSFGRSNEARNVVWAKLWI